jgi:hypothetical protein
MGATKSINKILPRNDEDRSAGDGSSQEALLRHLLEQHK